MDAPTLALSRTLFPWADFRSTKAGIKRPTQRDWRGPIPVVSDSTAARQHEVLWLDELLVEAAAFEVLDRGSVDFTRLAASRKRALSWSPAPKTMCASRTRAPCR